MQSHNNDSAVRLRALAIGVFGIILIMVPQFDWSLSATTIDFQSILEAIGATLVGAAVAFLIFEQVVIRLTEEKVTAAVVDAKIQSSAMDDDHAKAMASAILSRRFGDPHLGEMVSETLVRWSDTYLRPYWGLNVDLRASVADQHYYTYQVQRSYRVARAALQSKFVVRCLRSSNSYSRSVLRNLTADYTWAFAAHDETVDISTAEFEVGSLVIDEYEVAAPPPRRIKVSGAEYAEVEFDIAEIIGKLDPDVLVKIVFSFSVKQARRFGFFGISTYQPTLDFSARFDYSALPIDEVFLMEYFSDDEKVDISHPHTGVVHIEATDWVLPGNAAIFSWSDPEYG